MANVSGTVVCDLDGHMTNRTNRYDEAEPFKKLGTKQLFLAMANRSQIGDLACRLSVANSRHDQPIALTKPGRVLGHKRSKRWKPGAGKDDCGNITDRRPRSISAVTRLPVPRSWTAPSVAPGVFWRSGEQENKQVS